MKQGRKVRAKFSVTEVAHRRNQKEIKMHAVISDSEDNKDFTDATPDGELRIVVWNDAPASDFFKPDQELFVDFTVAKDPGE